MSWLKRWVGRFPPLKSLLNDWPLQNTQTGEGKRDGQYPHTMQTLTPSSPTPTALVALKCKVYQREHLQFQLHITKKANSGCLMPNNTALSNTQHCCTFISTVCMPTQSWKFCFTKETYCKLTPFKALWSLYLWKGSPQYCHPPPPPTQKLWAPIEILKDSTVWSNT